MKTLSISLSLVIIFVFAGCNDNSTTQPTTASEIKPLKYGNFWIFNRIEYYSESDSVIKEPFKQVILGDTIIDGHRLYFAKYFAPEDTSYNDTIYYPVPGTIRYYYNDSIGLHVFYIHIEMFNKWTEESLFLKYPTNSNESYSTELWGDFKVASLNEKVIVPAGTFTCYKYIEEHISTDIIERFYYYYTPGIGCIKYIATDEIFPEKEMIKVKEELVSYKIN